MNVVMLGSDSPFATVRVARRAAVAVRRARTPRDLPQARRIGQRTTPLSGMDLADDLLGSAPRFPDEGLLGSNIVTRNARRATHAVASTARTATGSVMEAGRQAGKGNLLTAAMEILTIPNEIVAGMTPDVVKDMAKRIAYERIQGVAENFHPGFGNIDILSTFRSQSLKPTAYGAANGMAGLDDALLRTVTDPRSMVSRIATALGDAVSNNFPVVNVPSFLVKEGVGAALGALGINAGLKTVATTIARKAVAADPKAIPKTATTLGLVPARSDTVAPTPAQAALAKANADRALAAGLLVAARAAQAAGRTLTPAQTLMLAKAGLLKAPTAGTAGITTSRGAAVQSAPVNDPSIRQTTGAGSAGIGSSSLHGAVEPTAPKLPLLLLLVPVAAFLLLRGRK